MENYIKHKLVGGPIILKSHVAPHIFDCQLDRKRAASTPQQSLLLRRQRKRLVEEAQEEVLIKEIKKYDFDVNITSLIPFTSFDCSAPSTSSTSDFIKQEIDIEEIKLEKQEID